MRIYSFVFMLVFTLPVFAAAPSEESLKELLTVTNAKQLLESGLSRIDSAMQQALQRSLRGKKLEPADQKAIDDMRVRMVALMKQEMSWDIVEPMFIDVYKQSLTQDEVDGMLKFYKTDAGQAVIKKMPLVMRHTMQSVQKRMMEIMPKVQQIKAETLATIRENHKNTQTQEQAQ